MPIFKNLNNPCFWKGGVYRTQTVANFRDSPGHRAAVRGKEGQGGKKSRTEGLEWQRSGNTEGMLLPLSPEALGRRSRV